MVRVHLFSILPQVLAGYKSRLTKDILSQKTNYRRQSYPHAKKCVPARHTKEFQKKSGMPNGKN